MKSEVRETGPLGREVEIHLETSEVRAFIDRMIDAYRRRYTFPGFRTGRAPAQLVMRRFHEEIDQAVRGELVPRAIEETLAENKIHPAGPGRLSRISYEPDQPLTFSVQLEVWPEIELKPYDELEVEQLVEEVSPEDVETYLSWLRQSLADTEPVDREARSGDVLEAELESVDLEGKRMKGTQKEKVTLEVGGANLLPEFRGASEGISAGESRELKVDYPEDFSNEQLRGQTRRYRMAAIQIREKKIPPLDDKFAGKIESGLELEGLRAKVRLRLESEKRLASRERLEQTITDRLIRENPFDLPGAPIQMALDRLAESHRGEGKEVDPEEIDKIYRTHIERAHRREFILAKVADREGIRVSPDDVEAEIARMARNENRKPEEVRKDLGDLDRLRNFLFERRVFDALMQKVKIREIAVPSSSSAKAGPEGAILAHAGSAAAEANEGDRPPPDRGGKESIDE